MAGKNIDYSLQIDDIRAPGMGNADNLVAAGNYRGKAAAIAGEKHAEALGFLGTLGLSAVKGYMESEVDKSIQDTLSKTVTDTYVGSAVRKQYEENIPKAKASVLAAKELAAQADPNDIFGSMDGSRNDAEIAAMKAEAVKYVTAAEQGAIGRDEAIARIATVVKKYSAIAPGWASDFRKIGAEMTGISSVDTYGIHKALTTQSEAEKLRLKQLEQDAALEKEAASALGLTSTRQLTPEALKLYRSGKQLGIFTQSKENEKKLGDLVQADADKVNQQLASAKIAQAVSGVAAEFAQLAASHLNADTPDKGLAAQRLGGQLSAKLDIVEAQLIESINAQTIGRNPMSRAVAEQTVKEVQSTFRTYKEAVKNQDGFNFWNQIIKASKGNAEHLLNSITLANPHMAQLNQLGMGKPMAEAWFAMGGDKQKFSAVFGKDAAEAMGRAMTNPQTYINMFGKVATGQASIADVQNVDPQIGKVVYNDVLKNIEDLVKNGEVKPEQRGVFSNQLAAYTQALPVGTTAEVNKFRELMLSPNMQSILSGMDRIQRANAVAPLLAKVDTTVPTMLKGVKGMVDLFNNIPDNKSQGHTASVVYDPITQLMKLDVKSQHPTRIDALGLPYSPTGSSEQRDALDTIKARLNWINTAVETATTVLPMVHYSNAPMADRGQLMLKTYKMFESGETGTLFSDDLRRNLEQPKGDKTSATPTNWQALNADMAAGQGERDAAAARARKAEGVTQSTVDQLKAALSAKGISKELKSILSTELKYTEMALGLKD